MFLSIKYSYLKRFIYFPYLFFEHISALLQFRKPNQLSDKYSDLMNFISRLFFLNTIPHFSFGFFYFFDLFTKNSAS